MLPHAQVKISTKKMSISESSSVEGTHNTDADGMITVSGTLNSTYHFDVSNKRETIDSTP